MLKGDLAIRLRRIIRDICAEKGLQIISGNVRANHVHILVSANLAPAKIAQHLKGKGSCRLQREFRDLQKRYWGRHLWARGYFCAIVGAVSSLDKLVKGKSRLSSFGLALETEQGAYQRRIALCFEAMDVVGDEPRVMEKQLCGGVR